MMTGVVTPNRQAVIELTLRSTGGQVNTVEAVIDTGFNGFLTLPPHLSAILRPDLRIIAAQISSPPSARTGRNHGPAHDDFGTD
jgi:predicted aspartyl protease